MTVRPTTAAAVVHAPAHAAAAAAGHSHSQAAGTVTASGHATQPPLPLMTLLSFVALATGIAIALLARP